MARHTFAPWHLIDVVVVRRFEINSQSMWHKFERSSAFFYETRCYWLWQLQGNEATSAPDTFNRKIVLTMIMCALKCLKLLNIHTIFFFVRGISLRSHINERIMFFLSPLHLNNSHTYVFLSTVSAVSWQLLARCLAFTVFSRRNVWNIKKNYIKLKSARSCDTKTSCIFKSKPKKKKNTKHKKCHQSIKSVHTRLREFQFTHFSTCFVINFAFNSVIISRAYAMRTIANPN